MTTADPASAPRGGQAEAARSSQRQRTRQSRKRTRPSIFRHRWTGRIILAAMTLLTLAYVGMGLRAADFGGRVSGLVGIDTTPGDLRYMMGAPAPAPAGSTADPRQWRYQLPEGGRMLATFDAANRLVERIECSDENMVPGSCPPVLGLGMGTPEEAIWYKLGQPSRQSYQGDVKLAVYDGLGVTFALKRIMIYKIIYTRRPSRYSYVPTAIRSLVP